MLNNVVDDTQNKEARFLRLYKIVQEREAYMSNEAKISQYNTILNFFMKFLQDNGDYSVNIQTILFWTYVKLGDVYYNEGTKESDNSKYFIAIEYYNQALLYSRCTEEKNRVLTALKDLYYYLGDEDALVKIEKTWAENHEKEDRFSAYTFLAESANIPQIKVLFLEKALDEVIEQDKNFYAKYQDTLNICSQLIVLYELLGDKKQIQRIKDLRERTLKLLN